MSQKPELERIGRFRIVGRLGKGGMGDVYKGIQEPLNRVVAIKVLPEEYARNDEFLQRFVTEAKAISLLEHQNIVGIYDYGVEGGLQYIAMRYVEGQSLAQKLASERRLPPETAVEYARQICRALKYAHEKEILHRDIKPQNILLGPLGRVFVTDFGIAKLYEQGSVTRTGVVVGTPEYMSPEQAEGRELNHQTDLYSLGIVLYEMLTGEPPFLGDNPLSVAYKHVNVPPPPIAEKRTGIPRRLELIVLKALKKDRTVRYLSADEFLQDLDRVFDDPLESATRGMDRISVVRSATHEATFDDEKRIADRRELDRRREPRRAFSRRQPTDPALAKIKRRKLFFVLLVLVIMISGLLNLFYSRYKLEKAEKSGIKSFLYAAVDGAGNPEFAIDENIATSWIGVIPSSTFTLSFWKANEINRMDIISGSFSSENSFNLYSRPKTVKLSINDSNDFTVELNDTGARQVVTLPNQRAVRKIKFTVLEVYKGISSAAPAVAEIKFWFSPSQ